MPLSASAAGGLTRVKQAWRFRAIANLQPVPGVIQTWRAHPCWPITGFAPDNQKLHDDLWTLAAQLGFAYRRLFDARLALTLRQHGVTEFATANPRDFEGFGFRRVWNPLDD